VIPLIDLKAQHRSIRDELNAAVGEVLDSAQFILGPQVDALETEFAAYCGVKHGIAVNSGTSALHLALLAAGVGPGDEVITVPFTFIATAAAVWYAGARPIFVDIEPATYTMDPAHVERAITPRTKAILPVHLYGQPADMGPIMDIARRRRLIVIEDAAQAHGAERQGRRAGSIGDLGCFSFYPSKNLGACGEGGMVVTDNAEFARSLRMLRDWGQSEKGRHQIKAFNYRLEGIQGALLRVKLRHLETWTRARQARAALYDRLLAATRAAAPVTAPGARHVYHLYTIRAAQRDALRQELAAQQIQTGVHYPIPVHLQEAFADLGHRRGDFPVAEKAATEVLSLPMYAELPEAQIEMVAAAIARSPHV